MEKWERMLRDRRIILLIGLILLAGLLALRRFELGIEFAGGTQIPITLEKEVQPDVQQEIVNTIKTRLSSFGMTQVNVRAISQKEIYVTVPKSDPQLLNQLSEILKKRGVYEGIVDGKVAISGDDMLPNTIDSRGVYPGKSSATWEVDFAISYPAADRFSKVVFGKGDYPVYMFLDRPKSAGIIIKQNELFSNESISSLEVYRAVRDALRKENDDIQLFVLGDWKDIKAQLANSSNSTIKTIIISNDTSPSIKSELASMNFTIVEKSSEEMTPNYITTKKGYIIEEWRAVGLLSSPTLSPEITGGSISQLYRITGVVYDARTDIALEKAQVEAKNIKSILSGGSLPVNAIVGSITTIPAPLGEEFLKYSLIGAILAFAFVSLVVFSRYRSPKILLPILFTGLIEIMILVCFVGSLGTIDLSAMAGIIASAGTSVDDQIVITDEILRKEQRTAKSKLERAFDIVIKRCTVAIIAMVPLLFSGLVEIIGFAMAAIIGTLLGVLVTRPAYGAIIEILFEEEK